MVLGIFLSSGDSFKNMSKSGQDVRFKYFYLRKFSISFSKIYVFSFENEKVQDLPPNIIVVPNKYSVNRFFYGIIMPFLNFKKVSECDVLRAYHLLGTMPVIIAKLFLGKSYIFNYAYDYVKFAKIEGKLFQIILIRLINYPAILFASKIIATTQEMFSLLPAQKTLFIPNGVDIHSFKPKKSRQANRKLKLLSVGRLEPQKNYLTLILALKSLTVDLLIVGSGSLKAKLLAFSKKKKVNLIIIDKVENLKLPAIYNQADIFVLPSLVEGPNKVILEAMACGLPVVATNISGIKEVIIDKYNGVLTRTDSASLRNSIIKLLTNPELREKLGHNARLSVEKRFDLKSLLKKEVQVLQQTGRNN